VNVLHYKPLIKAAQEPNFWDHGNNLLYKLCKDNFSHTNDETILTKTLFIGRIYAAAIERRKNTNGEGNDNFYKDKIIKTFKESELDNKLSELRNYKEVNNENILMILQTHKYLINELHKITELNKRSFCSKYLHFHLPELYFIYDSRSVSSLSKFKISAPKELQSIIKNGGFDSEYAKFYCKCYVLKKDIKKQLGLDLTTRQLDKLFIEMANKAFEDKRGKNY